MTKIKSDRDIPFITSSILNTYLRCKYNFYEQYIKNDGFSSYRADDESEPMYLTFGTLVHESIQDFWQSKERRTFSLLKKLYESKVEKFGFTDKSYIELGYDIIDKFFNYVLHKAPKRKVVASELSFHVNIKGVPLHGTIDQIFYLGNGVYEIEDYKTSKWLPTQDEVDENIQLSMYDLVFSSSSMKQHWYNGIQPKAIMLSLHFLRYGEVIHTEHSQDERNFTLNYFRMLYNQMRRLDESKFIPCPNSFCSFCGSSGCAYYQGVIDNTDSDEIKTLKAKYNLSDVADMISYYDSLNNRIKILNSESSAVYDDICESLRQLDSVVKVGDFEYFMGQSGYRYVNVNMAIKILSKYGLWEPMDFINSLPVGKLEHLLKDYPDVWEEIERKAVIFHYKNPQLKSKKIKKRGTL